MTIVPSQPKSPQKTCDTASHPWALCHTSTASVQHTVRLTVRPFSGTWDPLAQLAERPKDITLRRPDRVGSKQDHLEPKLYAKIQPHGVMLLRSFYIVCWFALFVESIFDDYFWGWFWQQQVSPLFCFLHHDVLPKLVCSATQCLEGSFLHPFGRFGQQQSLPICVRYR